MKKKYVVTITGGKRMSPWTLPKIKQDGNHKVNVKVQPPVAGRLNNVRPPSQVHPQKGLQNPPHYHVKKPFQKGPG